jgi:hypothetical protein
MGAMCICRCLSMRQMICKEEAIISVHFTDNMQCDTAVTQQAMETKKLANVRRTTRWVKKRVESWVGSVNIVKTTLR